MNVVTLFVIIVLIFLLVKSDGIKEPFYSYYGNYKKYCSRCDNKNRSQCSTCRNCGYGITPDGKGECMPGSKFEPAFRKDIMYWENQDPYYYYNPDELNIPKNTDIYPHYRYNIRKGRWGMYGRFNRNKIRLF